MNDVAIKKLCLMGIAVLLTQIYCSQDVLVSPSQNFEDCYDFVKNFYETKEN